jgi:hypothetical protein
MAGSAAPSRSSHVDADKIEASAQDGVLKILMPKPRETRKRIQVRADDRAVTPRSACGRLLALCHKWLTRQAVIACADRQAWHFRRH